MNTHIRNALIAMVRGETYSSAIVWVHRDGHYYTLSFEDDEDSNTRLIYYSKSPDYVGLYAHAAWTCDNVEGEARDVLLAAGELFGIEIPANLLVTVAPDADDPRRKHGGDYHVQLVGPLGLAALRAHLSTTVVEP